MAKIKNTGGAIIHVHDFYSGKTEIKNLEYHNKRKRNIAVKNEDLEYRKYNVQLEKNHVDDYFKYFNEHSTSGYDKALQEKADEMNKKDLFKFRDTKAATKIASLTVGLPIKVHPDNIESVHDQIANIGQDYLTELKKQKKFKNAKILSAEIHMDEIYLPVFDYDENGKVVRKLSDAERWERSYVKPHIHIDYIPLSEIELKNGKKVMSCSRKSFWRDDKKGRDWVRTFSEFNDYIFDHFGAKYGFARGEKWENFYDRKDKNEPNKFRTLQEWQITKDVDDYAQYKEILKKQREEEEQQENLKHDAFLRQLEKTKKAAQKKVEEEKEKIEKIRKLQRESSGYSDSDDLDKIIEKLGSDTYDDLKNKKDYLFIPLTALLKESDENFRLGILSYLKDKGFSSDEMIENMPDLKEDIELVFKSEFNEAGQH